MSQSKEEYEAYAALHEAIQRVARLASMEPDDSVTVDPSSSVVMEYVVTASAASLELNEVGATQYVHIARDASGTQLRAHVSVGLATLGLDWVSDQ